MQRDRKNRQLRPAPVGDKPKLIHQNKMRIGCKDKEHRTDIDNGITLTKEIHRLFHKIYGKKHNTKEQFEEFKHRYHNKEFKEVI